MFLAPAYSLPFPSRPFFLPFTFLLLPSCFEELLHQLAALGFQNAFDHFDAMIQLIGVADMKVRFDCSGLFVRRAVNQKRDPRLDQRARAHRARLDCRIDDCLCQPVIAKLPGRFAQRDDLGVRRRIAIRASAISRHRQQLIAADDASSDRDFSGGLGPRARLAAPRASNARASRVGFLMQKTLLQTTKSKL